MDVGVIQTVERGTRTNGLGLSCSVEMHRLGVGGTRGSRGDQESGRSILAAATTAACGSNHC